MALTAGQTPVRTTLGVISLREARELNHILDSVGIVALRRLLRGRFDTALKHVQRPETDPRRLDYERGALAAVQEVDTVLNELGAMILETQDTGEAQDDAAGDHGRPGSDEREVDRGPE